IGTLLICVGLSIWGRGVLRLLCTLIGLTAGMTAALLTGLLPPEHLATLGQSAWIALPRPPLHYGFDLTLVPPFLAAGIAAGLRTVGVITTAQRVNDAAWQRPDMNNVRKGVLADGLANLIGGALGTPGMSTSPS